MKHLSSGLICVLFLFGVGCSKGSSDGASGAKRDGSKEKPLVVMLHPSETGSSSIMDDYAPLLNAVTRVYGIHFDLKMGDSYNGVHEGMIAGHVDMTWSGAVPFEELRSKGAGELLATQEKNGTSEYWGGIFHRKDSGMGKLTDLKGKSIALGDPKSTSSFNAPLAELIKAGLDPVRDLQKIVMAGSHSGSLEQLEAGHVAGCGASINAYEKLIKSGAINRDVVGVLHKFGPLPAPAIVMSTKLPAELKAKLKTAFGGIDKAEGVTSEMLLGYGGKKVDRYNVDYDPKKYADFMATIKVVNEELINEVIDKAGQR
ncbi:MAG: phosphate/phosphite/phosphonate ABC transporter substrate-binding protein [Proteobacteria bacterium]|nr:phosphate/phosphite/phosphonate ABC transporter substrate-binding protein [Pseudomonadota bacterium]